jgi:RHS repeat-associated protein
MPNPTQPSLNRVGIRNSSDYSPFGVELDGRTVSLDGYRYGYQGSEKDNEFKGEGNSYTTEFRQLDSRLGRWLSVDPVIQPWQSSYCSMDNNPILYNDVRGDEVNPEEDFKKSRYNSVYLNLSANNTIYQSMLKKFKPVGDFDYTLSVNQSLVRVGARATTWSSPGFNGETFSALKSTSSFSTPLLTKTLTKIDHNGHEIQQTYAETDIAIAKTMIHEMIHAHIAGMNIKETGNHNTHSKYRDLLVSGLNEYNKDNNLGYTDEQIQDLSWVGLGKSDDFKKFIEGKMTVSGKTYDEEYSLWFYRVEDLQYKLVETKNLTLESVEKEGGDAFPPPTEGNLEKK